MDNRRLSESVPLARRNSGTIDDFMPGLRRPSLTASNPIRRTSGASSGDLQQDAFDRSSLTSSVSRQNRLSMDSTGTLVRPSVERSSILRSGRATSLPDIVEESGALSLASRAKKRKDGKPTRDIRWRSEWVIRGAVAGNDSVPIGSSRQANVVFKLGSSWKPYQIAVNSKLLSWRPHKEAKSAKSVAIADLFRVHRIEDGKHHVVKVVGTSSSLTLTFGFDNDELANSWLSELRGRMRRLKRFPESVKEGNLKKKSHNKKFNKWDFRWFVLESSQLYYFRSFADAESAEKKIPVSDILFVGKAEEEGESFCLEIQTSQRTWLLSCGDAKELHDWMSSLRLTMRSIKQVLAWGNGPGGQLGRGPGVKSEISPSTIQQLDQRDVIHLTAGAQHSLALLHDGTVMSWGSGSQGELGHGNSNMEWEPRRITGLDSHKVSMLAASEYSSLALTSEGSVFQWGRMLVPLDEDVDASDLTRGEAFKSGSETVPDGDVQQNCDNNRGDFMDVAVPIAVSGLKGWSIRQISVGPYHAAAVSDVGILFTWGQGFANQLGLGDTHDRASPCPVEWPEGGGDAWSVACGTWHTVSVSEQGLVYTWGSSEAGQLGHGNKDPSAVPKLVEGLQGEPVVSVDCAQFTSAAVTASGALFTWGKGELGQLGLGGRDLGSKQPARVRGALASESVLRVCCSNDCTAAVTSSGNIYFMGLGRHVIGGEDKDEPFLIESLSSRVGRVACGETFMIALCARHSWSTMFEEDSADTHCSVCDAQLTDSHRKHNCRRCCKPFCWLCASNKRPVLSLGYSHPVRLCDECNRECADSNCSNQNNNVLPRKVDRLTVEDTPWDFDCERVDIRIQASRVVSDFVNTSCTTNSKTNGTLEPGCNNANVQDACDGSNFATDVDKLIDAVRDIAMVECDHRYDQHVTRNSARSIEHILTMAAMGASIQGYELISPSNENNVNNLSDNSKNAETSQQCDRDSPFSGNGKAQASSHSNTDSNTPVPVPLAQSRSRSGSRTRRGSVDFVANVWPDGQSPLKPAGTPIELTTSSSSHSSPAIQAPGPSNADTNSLPSIEPSSGSGSNDIQEAIISQPDKADAPSHIQDASSPLPAESLAASDSAEHKDSSLPHAKEEETGDAKEGSQTNETDFKGFADDLFSAATAAPNVSATDNTDSTGHQGGAGVEGDSDLITSDSGEILPADNTLEVTASITNSEVTGNFGNTASSFGDAEDFGGSESLVDSGAQDFDDIGESNSTGLGFGNDGGFGGSESLVDDGTQAFENTETSSDAAQGFGDAGGFGGSESLVDDGTQAFENTETSSDAAQGFGDAGDFGTAQSFNSAGDSGNDAKDFETGQQFVEPNQMQKPEEQMFEKTDDAIEETSDDPISSSTANELNTDSVTAFSTGRTDRRASQDVQHTEERRSLQAEVDGLKNKKRRSVILQQFEASTQGQQHAPAVADSSEPKRAALKSADSELSSTLVSDEAVPEISANADDGMVAIEPGTNAVVSADEGHENTLTNSEGAIMDSSDAKESGSIAEGTKSELDSATAASADDVFVELSSSE